MSHFFNVLHLELALHLDSVTDSQTLLTLLAYFLYIGIWAKKHTRYYVGTYTIICIILFYMHVRKKRLSFLFVIVFVMKSIILFLFFGENEALKTGKTQFPRASLRSYIPVVYKN